MSGLVFLAFPIFSHEKKQREHGQLASGYATFQSPVCPSSSSSSPFLVSDIHGEEEVKVLLALFSQRLGIQLQIFRTNCKKQK